MTRSPIKMQRRASEGAEVVKPILQWLAAKGFVVLDDRKQVGLCGFRFASWVIHNPSCAPPSGVVWRQNTGCAPMVGKGGKVRPIKFGQPGMADIVGVLNGGRWLAIECKRPGGKLEKDSQQEAFRTVMLAMGGVYILATTIDDVAEGLKEQGVL